MKFSSIFNPIRRRSPPPAYDSVVQTGTGLPSASVGPTNDAARVEEPAYNAERKQQALHEQFSHTANQTSSQEYTYDGLLQARKAQQWQILVDLGYKYWQSQNLEAAAGSFRDGFCKLLESTWDPSLSDSDRHLLSRELEVLIQSLARLLFECKENSIVSFCFEGVSLGTSSGHVSQLNHLQTRLATCVWTAGMEAIGEALGKSAYATVQEHCIFLLDIWTEGDRALVPEFHRAEIEQLWQTGYGNWTTANVSRREDSPSAVVPSSSRGSLPVARSQSQIKSDFHQRFKENRSSQIKNDEKLALRLAKEDAQLKSDESYAHGLYVEALQEEARLKRDASLAQALYSNEEEVQRVRNGTAHFDDDQMATYQMNLDRRVKLPQSRFAGSSMASQSEQKECMACTDAMPVSKLVGLLCQHDYCTPCLSIIFKQSMAQGARFPPQCCQKDILPVLVKPFLVKEVVAEFERRSEELSTDVAKRTYCRIPSCGEFLRRASIKDNTGTCRQCGQQTCIICKGETHGQLDCPSDKDSARLLELAKSQNYQYCTKCWRLIELGEGCLHITCHCRYEFCYKCGAEWKTHDSRKCNDRTTARLVDKAAVIGAQTPSKVRIKGKARS